MYSDDERIHSAYLSLRKYSSVWSCYEKHRGARDETGAQHENLNKLLNLKIKSTISNDVRAGVLLISHPLAAQHYKRSVILLLKHDENGSQGIIVNHRSEQLLPSAIENLPSTLLQKNYTLNFGGTVARLNCVHNCKQLGGESIQNCTSPLFHGIDLSLITKLPYPCQNKTSKIHLFIGSCVWPPEELKNQIKIGFWLPVETHNDAFFDLIQGIDEERKSYNFHTNETALSYCTKSDGEQECVNTNNTSRTGLISTLVLLLKISLLFSSHLSSHLCYFSIGNAGILNPVSLNTTADDTKRFDIAEEQEIKKSQDRKYCLWKIILKSIVRKQKLGKFENKDTMDFYSHVAELSSSMDIFTVDSIEQ